MFFTSKRAFEASFFERLNHMIGTNEGISGFSWKELYTSYNWQFVTHTQSKNKPIFQCTLQFIAASFQIFCLCPNALKIGNFTIILTIFEDFVFCQSHGILNISNQHELPLCVLYSLFKSSYIFFIS